MPVGPAQDQDQFWNQSMSSENPYRRTVQKQNESSHDVTDRRDCNHHPDHNAVEALGGAG